MTIKPISPPVHALPEYAYRQNEEFRSIVDLLEGALHACHLTPTELREAAALACTHYAMRSLSKYVYVGGALMPPQRAEDFDPNPPVVLVNGVPYRRE